MALTLSIPGKTFLAGEYLALDGGMALLAMTGPRYRVRVSPGSAVFLGFPENSPADRFLKRRAEAFISLNIEFRDPHRGAGGFGASTAQYLALASIERSGLELGRGRVNLDEKRLLENYRLDSWDGRGRAPSGADLIGQLHGGFTFFERATGHISREEWPFDDLRGFLIRTGKKVATHEHLRDLGELKTEDFAAIMAGVRAAWSSGDGAGFADGIREYSRRLQADRLVVDHTLSLLHDLLWLDGVKAAKGCGALGADVVLALIEPEATPRFSNWLADRGLEFVSLQDVDPDGLRAEGPGV